ncbi:amidase family protein, partial [Leucobacter soli]
AAALRSFAADVARQWGAYDVVLTPALASPAPRVGAFRALGPEGDYRLQCEWAPQTSMVNVAGLPAVTAPTHRTAAGLPMSVQLIGRAGDEVRLLQLAAQLAA